MVHSSQEEMLNEKGSMGNGLLCCMGYGSCCPGEEESVGGLVGLTTAIVNGPESIDLVWRLFIGAQPGLGGLRARPNCVHHAKATRQWSTDGI